MDRIIEVSNKLLAAGEPDINTANKDAIELYRSQLKFIIDKCTRKVKDLEYSLWEKSAGIGPE